MPGVLALTLGTPPARHVHAGRHPRLHGVDGGDVTSSASAAALSVRDPSPTATGRLVNGSSALTQPLQLNASARPTRPGRSPPLSTSGTPCPCSTLSTPVGTDRSTIGLKQSIAATEALLSGGYAKTLVFTLSATTP